MLAYGAINAKSFLVYKNRNPVVLIGWLNCFKPIMPQSQYFIIPKGRSPY